MRESNGISSSIALCLCTLEPNFGTRGTWREFSWQESMDRVLGKKPAESGEHLFGTVSVDFTDAALIEFLVWGSQNG